MTTRRLHRLLLLVAITAAVLSACADDAATGAPVLPTPEPDLELLPDVPPDAVEHEPDAAPEDVPENLPAIEDTGLHIDAFFEDSFTRPEPDVPPDTLEDVDQTIPAERREGQTECLHHILEVQGEDLTFRFGEDLLLIIWDVRNHCSRNVLMRVHHSGDFLPIMIHKDGLPWLAYPDCFGRGEPYEPYFEFGNGLRKGWIWTGPNHHAWIDNCAAEPFEPTAVYEVVGYGATEVVASDDQYSDIFPMSEPIRIELVE